VELRYFVGLSVEETAEVLKVSLETVNRVWRMAKVWLLRELQRRKD
jgi:DNA-directed RNA polymerase specialized sigma24 family protein